MFGIGQCVITKKLQNLYIMHSMTDLFRDKQLIVDFKRKKPINIFHGQQKLYLSCWYSVLQ